MPLTDAALAIDFYAVPVPMRRYGDTYTAGLYDETGNWNENVPWNPEPVETTIQAFATSPRPRDIQNLPEGVQELVTWTVWTRTDLQADDDTIGARGDELKIRGEWCRVVWLWPRREGGYSKALLGVIRDRGRTVHQG